MRLGPAAVQEAPDLVHGETAAVGISEQHCGQLLSSPKGGDTFVVWSWEPTNNNVAAVNRACRSVIFGLVC